jgi:hypothetical protein
LRNLFAHIAVREAIKKAAKQNMAITFLRTLCYEKVANL